MEKINKSKARRLVKEAKKAQYAGKADKVIMPKKTGTTDMVKVLRPAFAVRNEHQEALTKLALAITRLRLGVGTEEDLGFMYGRVLFGRRIANAYFAGHHAEELHHALQTIVLAAQDQIDLSSGNLAHIHITETDVQEISDALQIIELMTSKITPEQYLAEAMQHQATPMMQPEQQLQDWEAVAEDEAFLASVKGSGQVRIF